MADMGTPAGGATPGPGAPPGGGPSTKQPMVYICGGEKECKLKTAADNAMILYSPRDSTRILVYSLTAPLTPL